MQNQIIGELLYISCVSGLLGVFYRNILKGENMILYPLYKVLAFWVATQYISKFRYILGWIAYPLGYCIYCSTTWISLFLYYIYISSWSQWPIWQWVVIGGVSSVAISHLIVTAACKWLLTNHLDWDNGTTNKTP